MVVPGWAGSSWVISMFSCLGRPRFVPFCWIFEPGLSSAVATRDVSLQNKAESAELEGTTNTIQPNSCTGPSPGATPSAQQHCMHQNTKEKKLKRWEQGAGCCWRMGLIPPFPRCIPSGAPAASTPAPSAHRSRGGAFVFAQKKKGEQLPNHTSAHSFSCL